MTHRASGVLPPGTYDNVLVPPGQSCSISNSVVLGNVKALERSRLVIRDSNVRGNVDGDKADLVQIVDTIVRQNVTIKEGGPAESVPPGGFTCSFGAELTPCEALVLRSTVQEGHVQVEKMDGTVWVQASIMKGNVKTEENFMDVPEFLFISSTTAQNVQVFKNKGSGNKAVSGNTVGENLQCFENDPPFVAAGNTAKKSEGQCF